MIKLNILNLKNFLGTVNQCSGNVTMLLKDGKKVNINGHSTIQHELQEQYIRNSNFLPITLEFDNPKDYMKIVYYYIGDC